MRKPTMTCVLVLALLSASALQTFGQTIPPATETQEARVIADFCRQLAIIGTEDVVPALAGLLGHERCSHMARYALEPMPYPAVDEALRDALGKLKGRPLVGVIGSIGVRRDAEAVQPLSQILMQNEAGPYAMSAALRALGQIGTVAAADVLKTSLDHAPPEGLPDVYEGLFRCAERFAAEGNNSAAIEIYDILRARDASHQVRAGALRGAILARGKDGIGLLREHLRSDDYILFSAACQTALEMSGSQVTQALTAAVNELPADNRILVIWTLGKRADVGALPALSALAKKGEKSVRLEAIRALPQIGDASAVPVLAELMGNADTQISRAAQDGLAALPGQKADEAVLAMLDGRQTAQRLTALDLMGRRRMTKSIPALLKAAGDADPEVRPAAIRTVGELGGVGEVSPLLDVLMRLSESQDLSAAERALSSVCIKTDNPQSQAGKLIGSLARAAPGQKAVLLRVLSIIGGPEALKAVRAAVDDADGQVRDAAIRALCAWKTADAAPDLLALVKTSPEPSRRTAALRGYISMVRDESLSTGQKLAMCKQAAGLITRNEDKKLLLGVLGTVPATEALSMAMAHLDDEATKDEACFAAVAISEKIVEQNPREVTEALQKVLNATGNRDVTRRARQTLQKAKKG